ncbi:MAG: VOC family protein [Coriobacteriia bacterium]|nr:VOC family protein [Coriobacteriia bacterium]
MERTKPGSLNWVDLGASDIEGQTVFYEGLFGWTHTDVPFDQGPVYKIYALDGKTVAGGTQINPAAAAAGAPTAWNTYIRADDVDATAKVAQELGGQIVMPTMDVPGQGRIVGIADPTGATFFLWKPLQPDATTQYMEAGTYGWAQLNTRDPQTAVEFYEKLFGWELVLIDWDPTHPYWQVLVDGEGQAGIAPMPEAVPASMPAFWRPNFMTADIDVSITRVIELGGTIISPKAVIPGRLATAEVRDPAGAMFTLLQPYGQM